MSPIQSHLTLSAENEALDEFELIIDGSNFSRLKSFDPERKMKRKLSPLCYRALNLLIILPLPRTHISSSLEQFFLRTRTALRGGKFLRRKIVCRAGGVDVASGGRIMEARSASLLTACQSYFELA